LLPQTTTTTDSKINTTIITTTTKAQPLHAVRQTAPQVFEPMAMNLHDLTTTRRASNCAAGV